MVVQGNRIGQELILVSRRKLFAAEAGADKGRRFDFGFQAVEIIKLGHRVCCDAFFEEDVDPRVKIQVSKPDDRRQDKDDQNDS